MFSYCPKCETGKLNAAGNCGICGYSLRNKCSDCGHLNIPGARFCGGCGQGMTALIRAQTFVNRQVSFMQRLKMRRFATGLAFGGLLSFFAFGSMGMQGNHENGRLLPSYFQAQRFSFHEDFAVRFEKDLQSPCLRFRQRDCRSAPDCRSSYQTSQASGSKTQSESFSGRFEQRIYQSPAQFFARKRGHPGQQCHAAISLSFRLS